MNQNAAEDRAASEPASSATGAKDGVDWEDPSIPVGNAPPLPKWPVVVFSLAWFGWIVFLAAMAASRTDGGIMRTLAGS